MVRNHSGAKEKAGVFPNSSHMVMMEEPGRMYYHLMTDVRPLALAADSSAAAK